MTVQTARTISLSLVAAWLGVSGAHAEAPAGWHIAGSAPNEYVFSQTGMASSGKYGALIAAKSEKAGGFGTLMQTISADDYRGARWRLTGFMKTELAGRAQLPMPKVYIIHEDQPNAFATGRNPDNAAVAATTGILQMLSERELRGVMAHELAHVRHRDILISTISATMAGAISALANFAMMFGGRDESGRPANPIASIAVALLAPLAASLIQMAISRAREFEADRGGAEIAGDPNALADALLKIDAFARGIPMPTAEAHPETGQMMIMNPLSGHGLAGLFSTHPATEERVARLRALSRR